MDFLFAKSWGPQSYFRYTILNVKWTFCASMRNILRCVFVFICYLFAFLENMCFVCNSMGNGSVEGAITSKMFITQKCTLISFMIFAENVTLMSRNIIKLIPLEASSSKYKSPLSPCNYTRVSKLNWPIVPKLPTQ